MLYVVNFANGEPFETYRKVNTKTAYRFGKADKVIEYSLNDIPAKYFEEHKQIFSHKRGIGLWLWKPYLISKALSSINNDDWMFYCDSGTIFIRNISLLIECAEKNKQDIILTEQPLLNRQFTKRECYEIMKVKDNNENQLLGGFILIKKTKISTRFIDEWLHHCEKEELISYKYFHPEISEFNDFYAHREDQSILTLLRIKYNLPSFRDCTDYGEMPFMYFNTKYTYNPQIYLNSNYPTILLLNRKIHPYKYFISYIAKKILNKLGIYYTEKAIVNRRSKNK